MEGWCRLLSEVRGAGGPFRGAGFALHREEQLGAAIRELGTFWS